MNEYRGISYYCNDGIHKKSRFPAMRLFISPNFDRSNETMKLCSCPVLLPISNELQAQHALDTYAIRCGYWEV